MRGEKLASLTEWWIFHIQTCGKEPAGPNAVGTMFVMSCASCGATFRITIDADEGVDLLAIARDDEAMAEHYKAAKRRVVQ
jgi:hypothetical protein